MKHLSQEQIEALVMAWDAKLDESARQHLADCVECAQRLAREARLESHLYEVAASTPRGGAHPHPDLGRWWRIVLPAAAALVVVVLSVRLMLPRARKDAAPPSVHASGTRSVPSLDDPCSLGPGACLVPPEDVCRYAIVEKNLHPSF